MLFIGGIIMLWMFIPFTLLIFRLFVCSFIVACILIPSVTTNIITTAGGWNREQFYLWAADYLRWLWYHEGDAALPKLALFALKPLLEYDAEVSQWRETAMLVAVLVAVPVAVLVTVRLMPCIAVGYCRTLRCYPV